MDRFYPYRTPNQPFIRDLSIVVCRQMRLGYVLFLYSISIFAKQNQIRIHSKGNPGNTKLILKILLTI